MVNAMNQTEPAVLFNAETLSRAIKIAETKLQILINSF